MKYPLIAAKIYDEPWLISPATLRKIQGQFEAHIMGGRADSVIGEESADDSEPYVMGTVQIIPVHGILGKHLSQFEMLCGGCSLDELSKRIQSAEDNPRIETILFEFRSPGGTVTGVPECAAKIDGCTKSTVAFTDSECCSAALWLASACGQFYATESAVLGACGVYGLFMDRTAQMEKEGVKVNAISAGEFKLAGASFKPMTDSERAMFTEQAVMLHEKFKAVIQANRKVDNSYLEGQCFRGEQAESIGIVDDIFEDLESLVAELQ